MSSQKKYLSRVLFLRSNCQSTFAAFVANGLVRSTQITFEQFPPVPAREWHKIEKIYDPEEGLSSLDHNLVCTCRDLINRLSSGEYDLVILLDYDGRLFSYQQLSFLTKIRYFLGQLKKIYRIDYTEIKKSIRLMKGVSIPLDEINQLVPVVVIDLDDWICLPPAGQKNLESCSLYFKRELPVNRFFLYYQHRPAPWRIWRKKLAPLLGKVDTIPLGIEDKKYFALKSKRKRKQDIDVFYCGEPSSSPRLTALTKLKELAATTSWKIVIADSLPFDEYCHLIARSKITISISGGGWDCFRHYESVALGSFPLMDKPVVDASCWRDLPDEFFFENSFINFDERLESILCNDQLRKVHLKLIEKKIEEYMVHSMIVEHIVRYSMASIYGSDN
jgi:hypothetical protein